MTTAALIYAGGHATRLGGRNKAALVIDGVTLLDRVYHALGESDPVLLSIGPREPMASALILPRHQIRDLDGRDLGPIGALAAGVEWLLNHSHGDFLLTAAVDTPFFPADFLARAHASLATNNAAVAAYGDHLYPTNTLWRPSAIADLPARLRAGTAPNAPKKLASEIGFSLVDYTHVTTVDPFLNVNTEADLEALRRRATL